MKCLRFEHDLLAGLAGTSPKRRSDQEEPPTTAEQFGRADLEAYQLAELRKTVSRVCDRASFYRDRCTSADQIPWPLGSLRDLARLPLTEPKDLASAPYAFACVSQAAIARAMTFTSSGTTGPQKRVFFSEADLERMTDFMAAGMRTVAATGDVVQIMLPAGPPNSQADLLSKGVLKMGGVPVVTGTAPTVSQLEAIKKYHPAVIFGSTGRLYRLTKEAEQLCQTAELGLRCVFVTSEYLSSSMRENLREAWGAEVASHYGMTEMGLGVAVECGQGDGYHFDERDLIVEVIDPQTGAVLGDGAEGELVFTTLHREAMPILRYRTHDIARVWSAPCEHGATVLKKIGPIIKRTGGILRLNGGELYPSLLDEAIFRVREVIDWRASLVGAEDPKTLHIQVELVDGAWTKRTGVRKAVLQVDSVREAVESGELRLVVELLPSGSLIRTSRAKKLIAQLP